jgi:hypothetical protein
MWIISNKNWKTPKKIICNSRYESLGLPTWKKQSFTTACESIDDWTTTKTTRSVG